VQARGDERCSSVLVATGDPCAAPARALRPHVLRARVRGAATTLGAPASERAGEWLRISPAAHIPGASAQPRAFSPGSVTGGCVIGGASSGPAGAGGS
jgi:hypothetical protein